VRRAEYEGADEEEEGHREDAREHRGDDPRATMPTMPPGMNREAEVPALNQTTHSEPLDTMAMPVSPPTTEWVVETGISNLVARISQMPTAPMTQRLPYMRTAASMYEPVKQSVLAMPLRIVSATEEPARTAPLNSKTTASTHACLMVSALEPTEVAYALATSLAPMSKAVKQAAIRPKTSIQVYLRAGSGSQSVCRCVARAVGRDAERVSLLARVAAGRGGEHVLLQRRQRGVEPS